MRTVLRFSADEALPEAAAVLAAKGMPGQLDDKTAPLLADGFELYRKLAAPAGLFEAVAPDEFSRIYPGEGQNAPASPLAAIFPKATALALFCVTIGPGLTDEISRRFERHDYALGYVLDAVASAGAEKTADILQSRYSAVLHSDFCLLPSAFVLRYSPGYCGWHVTGQKKLFARLRPEEIGVTLRESCLMEPLKSISGVFVAAPAEVHRFRNDYPFCSECSTPTCRGRIAALPT